MRNFEADKLVRLGDVMDALEEYTRSDSDNHEIDLGDAGYHTFSCDWAVDLDDVASILSEKVIEQ